MTKNILGMGLQKILEEHSSNILNYVTLLDSNHIRFYSMQLFQAFVYRNLP